MRLSIRAPRSTSCWAVLALGLASLVGASLARAEGRWCEWTNAQLVGGPGELRCYADTTCDGDLDCRAVDAPDRICVSGLGTCVPPCSTIRLCDEPGDCPGGTCTRLSGRRPTIDPESYSPSGVCVSDSHDTFPPPALFCDESWERWADAYARNRPFAILGGIYVPVLTNAWGFGDGDDDGCPNAIDATPCMPDAVCPAREPDPPPTCPADSGSTCCVAEGPTLVCDDVCPCSTIRACTPAPEVLAHPSCESLSPMGRNGLCVRPDAPGVLGFCVYEEYLEDCSRLGDITLDSCFQSPTGEFTPNFYAGDCDGDGCPNGQDPDRCVPCDGVACLDTTVDPRVECPAMLTDPWVDPPACFPEDAGIDAGVEDLDASASLDAPASPPTSFGGSGCRCAVGGASRDPMGIAAALLAILVAVGRRRRIH
ncbi:MAG: hypothetical protein K1X94_21100 [Sandaracinaceae bacterium]|nr:hypothetical protein [Sandaracinaceae bacterium]